MSRPRWKREPFVLPDPPTPRERLTGPWTPAPGVPTRPWTPLWDELAPFVPVLEVPDAWRAAPPDVEAALPERFETLEDWNRWLLAADWPTRLAALTSRTRAQVPSAHPLLWWAATGEELAHEDVAPGHRWMPTCRTLHMGTVLETDPESLARRLAIAQGMRTTDWLEAVREVPNWPPAAWLEAFARLLPTWWGSALMWAVPTRERAATPESLAAAAAVLAVLVHRARWNDVLEDCRSSLEDWVVALTTGAPDTAPWPAWRQQLVAAWLGDQASTMPVTEQAYWRYHHRIAGVCATLLLLSPATPPAPDHLQRLEAWWAGRLRPADRFAWAWERILRELPADVRSARLAQVTTPRLARALAPHLWSHHEIDAWPALRTPLPTGQQRRLSIAAWLQLGQSPRGHLRFFRQRGGVAKALALRSDPRFQDLWLTVAPRRRWPLMRRHLCATAGQSWDHALQDRELQEFYSRLLYALGPESWATFPPALWRRLLQLPDKTWRVAWLGARATMQWPTPPAVDDLDDE